MSRSGEFNWIEKYLAPLAGPGSFALKDDAALVDLGSQSDFVVTQDAILEGIHFLKDCPPKDVARKALRVNLSDMIAKGARAVSYSLALGVPDRWQDQDMAEFAEGLAADQKTFGCTLSGGDTYRSPERLCVSITLMGVVDGEAGADHRYVARSGAREGDNLYLLGPIGDAALGLKVALGNLKTQNDDHHFLDIFKWPLLNPQIASGISRYASASMDVSDGLLGDCRKLCAASNVSAHIERENIPLSEQTKRALNNDPDLWEDVLSGGDDYQVLCTVPKANQEPFEAFCASVGPDATKIGTIGPLSDVGISITYDGVPLSIKTESFSHF